MRQTVPLAAHSPRFLRTILAAVLAAILFQPHSQPAQAAGTTVTVNNLGDAVPANNGVCTLREALLYIGTPALYNGLGCGGNTAPPGPFMVKFSSAGTVTLSDVTDLPDVSSNVTISGPIIIDRQFKNRHFLVGGSGVLNLVNVTLTHGRTDGVGGAIYVKSGSGSVNITGSALNGNEAASGGAIHSNGDIVSVVSSTLSGNRALTETGGAIFYGGLGKLTIGGSVFSGNTAKRSGGAIMHLYRGEIADTVFNGNVADGNGNPQDASDGGGAIFNEASLDSRKLSVVRSVFNGNVANRGMGGAIFNKATTIITDSSFNLNVAGVLTSATMYGGAIFNQEELYVTRAGFFGNATPNGRGGAISNDRAGLIDLGNVTMSQNASLDRGGAIYNNNLQAGSSVSATVKIRNGTIAYNLAPSGPDLYNDVSANPEHRIFLGNTIIAKSIFASCNTALSSYGRNIEFGASCGLTGPGDLQNADPKLGPLSFNGGALADLLSFPLLGSSPAIDSGDAAICDGPQVFSLDQAGKPRINDGDGLPPGGCDRGAFENGSATPGFGSDPVAPGPLHFGNVLVGATVSATLAVTSTGTGPLTIGGASITGSAAADYALIGSLPPALLPENGSAIIVTCTPSAEGARSASLALTTNDPANTNPTFTLACNGTTTPVPGFSATPAAPGPLAIGKVLIGSSKVANISVAEQGSAPLTVNTPVLGGQNPGEFSVNPALSLTLPDGGPSQAIPVTCTPTGSGPRSATLTVSTNDPAKPSVLFSLTCVGAYPPDPALTFNASTGGINAGNGPYAIDMTGDGSQVLITAADGNSLVIDDRFAGDGSLASHQPAIPSSAATPFRNPRGLEVSTDGLSAYATGVLSDSLVVFTRTEQINPIVARQVITSGTRYICGPGFVTCPLDVLDSPQGVTLSPDGRHTYVVSNGSGAGGKTLAKFNRNLQSGRLSFGLFDHQRLKHGVGGVSGLDSPNDVTVSPDGNHVYVAGGFALLGGAVTVFQRNQSTGALTFVQTYNSGDSALISLAGASAVLVSPDSAYVYVAGLVGASFNGSVSVFRRSPLDGTLSLVAAYSDSAFGLAGANGLAFSPGGHRLYVSNSAANSLAVFERDEAEGTLLHVQTLRDGVDSVDGLGGAAKVTASPDGTHVYVTGYAEDKIAVFNVANPKPIVASILPASAPAGNADLTVTVNGERFIPASQVRWNGTARPTTYVNGSQVRVLLSAGDLATAGTGHISVSNPSPGGGVSSNLAFAIQAPGDNPIPAVASLVPAGAVAGSAGFNVAVQGAGFVPGAMVLWNGFERSTTYVSASQLQAFIPATDLLAAGASAVSVANPGPGGGASNSVAFTVASPGQNPPPAILSLSPASAVAGAGVAELAVDVHGASFADGVQARWNGDNRPTQFVSPSLVRVTLGAADLAVPGTFGISAVNPAPGGGASNVATFTVLEPGSNPVPTLAGAAITSTGDGTWRITLTGSGFIASSVVYWNGQAQPTTVVSGSSLSVVLNSELAGALATVIVVNPAPGGGTSNELLYQPLVRRVGVGVALKVASPGW